MTDPDDTTTTDDSGTDSPGYLPTDPDQMTGRKVSVKLHYTYEREVEILMPLECDEGLQADEHLRALGELTGLNGELDLIHTDILGEDPVYYDEYPWEEVPDAI